MKIFIGSNIFTDNPEFIRKYPGSRGDAYMLKQALASEGITSTYVLSDSVMLSNGIVITTSGFVRT